MHLSKKYFSNAKVYHLFPTTGGSIDPDEFYRELRKVTLMEGSPEEIMNALPNRSAMVIHDLELWWERSDSGMDGVKTIEWLIATYSYKCLFLINTNPFAYELINKLHRLEHLFISTIRSRPFLSEELRDLVMSRHRSSGLHFRLSKKDEQQISDIKIARLFNRYFDFSEGNPGVALNAWLANVVHASTREIEIKLPERPNLRALEHLPDDWNIVLLQLVIHKRLSFARLLRMLQTEEWALNDLLTSLFRGGLIKERSSGVYFVNAFVEPFLVKLFKQKEWL